MSVPTYRVLRVTWEHNPDGTQAIFHPWIPGQTADEVIRLADDIRSNIESFDKAHHECASVIGTPLRACKWAWDYTTYTGKRFGDALWVVPES